ncbi:MAG: septal ring lytic transglycosylase RlpA family protein [Cyclonatronaceae bacterium]
MEKPAVNISILWLVLLLLAPAFVTSCEMKDGEDADVVLQEGVASWYGPGFHGRRTSNGEIYDANDSTAAHRTLPFDTIVRVVDTETERSVQVRINDRGPYVGDRIIDLSRAAAETLDMLDSGTAQVRLELVEAGGPIPDDLDQERYTIQLAEYSGPFYAHRFAEEIGGDVRVDSVYMFQRSRFMVYYGYYDNVESARAELRELRERGHRGFVKQIN